MAEKHISEIQNATAKTKEILQCAHILKGQYSPLLNIFVL